MSNSEADISTVSMEMMNFNGSFSNLNTGWAGMRQRCMATAQQGSGLKRGGSPPGPPGRPRAGTRTWSTTNLPSSPLVSRSGSLDQVFVPAGLQLARDDLQRARGRKVPLLRPSQALAIHPFFLLSNPWESPRESQSQRCKCFPQPLPPRERVPSTSRNPHRRR